MRGTTGLVFELFCEVEGFRPGHPFINGRQQVVEVLVLILVQVDGTLASYSAPNG